MKLGKLVCNSVFKNLSFLNKTSHREHHTVILNLLWEKIYCRRKYPGHWINSWLCHLLDVGFGSRLCSFISKRRVGGVMIFTSHSYWEDEIMNNKCQKAMAPHSGSLAWKIPWMEEPGGLQSMGSLRVGYNWATSLCLFTFMHWRRKWQPTPVFLPGESQGRGSLVGCRLCGRTESDTTEAT